MVIKPEQMVTEQRENMRDGQGIVSLLGLVPQEYMPQKCRLFSLITLMKGCSVGVHAHEGETEIYYVLEGQGVLNDNGTITDFNEGESSICASGEHHAVTNIKDAPLKLLAVIIRD